jgi:SAM-dependent methyltransferase
MDWNDPEWVRFFAEREPDVHLVQVLEESAEPASLRVLDLGCAAGRNTEAFLHAGCETYALDRAPAMLAATWERVGGRWPPGTGEGRVLRGDMRALPYRDEAFDLIAALGIYHEAECDAELAQSLQETRRVLRPGGRVLVSVFAVDMLPPEAQRVAGQRFQYAIPDGRRQCRVSEEELLTLCADAGLVPLRPVEKRGREGRDRQNGDREGRRVTLLGLFAVKPFL